MNRYYTLLALLIASFTAHGQCAFVDILVSSSDTAYVQLYHPGFFNMPSGFANMDAWEITTFAGDIVHEETAGGSFEESFILFDHSVPITDSMVVTMVITNDISGIICTIIDTSALSRPDRAFPRRRGPLRAGPPRHKAGPRFRAAAR